MIGQGCAANGEGRAGCGRPWCQQCYPVAVKRLTSGKQELGPAARYETPGEEIQRLLEENRDLRYKLDWSKVEYAKLQDIYNKLADQWNAFQATSKPDNRNVHRAEAAGEMARKLAEVFIGLAYDKDALPHLLEVLKKLAEIQYEGRTSLARRAPDDVAKKPI